MIIGSGFDFLQNDRIRQELSRSAWSKEDGIFSAQEISYCNGRKRRTPFLYGTCFAAKEAAIKALGIEVRDVSLFQEIELIPDSHNVPTLRFSGRLKERSRELGVRRIWVAVTSSSKLSGAIVVLES